MIDNQTHSVKAYLAGVNLDDPNFDYSMTELANLAEANNFTVVGSSQQKAEKHRRLQLPGQGQGG